MLENPTTIVIMFIAIIAGVVLIYYGYNAFKRYLSPDEKKPWPPVYSPCPDYWTDLGGKICKNDKLLGKCNMGVGSANEKSMDGDITTVAGRLKLCDWAKSCNISWEGIDSLC